MLKTVSIVVQTYDPETGEPNGNMQATGLTEDDGATVSIPLGYLYGIEAADPADVSMVVNQPPLIVPVAGVAIEQRADDQLITVTWAS